MINKFGEQNDQKLFRRSRGEASSRWRPIVIWKQNFSIKIMHF